MVVVLCSLEISFIVCKSVRSAVAGRSVVAWNPRFLEVTGFFEDEMKTSKAEELLTFGESWFPLSDERERAESLIYRLRGKAPFWRGSRTGICDAAFAW